MKGKIAIRGLDGLRRARRGEAHNPVAARAVLCLDGASG